MSNQEEVRDSGCRGSSSAKPCRGFKLPRSIPLRWGLPGRIYFDIANAKCVIRDIVVNWLISPQHKPVVPGLLELTALREFLGRMGKLLRSITVALDQGSPQFRVVS